MRPDPRRAAARLRVNAAHAGSVEGSMRGIAWSRGVWASLVAGLLAVAACATPSPPPPEPRGPFDPPPLRTCNAYDYGSPIAGDPCVRPGDQWRFGPRAPLSDAGLDGSPLVTVPNGLR